MSEYLNTTVECIDDSRCSHTKGKKYKVLNGEIQVDDGAFCGPCCKSVQEINERWSSQFKEVAPQFTKSDLRSGDMVVMENGEKYIVMLNPRFIGNGNKPKDSPADLVNIHGGFMTLNDYDENLNRIDGQDEYEIVEIIICEDFTFSHLFSDFASINWKSIWKRPDPPKQITITKATEICKDKLGCEVEIVRDKE